MRAVLLVLILAVVVIIGAVATGFVNIKQLRGAQAPDINASGNGVTATGGQTPSFDIETGSVGVGARDATITVPELRVNPAANEATPAQPRAPAQPQAPPANAM
jgi:uncharacterized membrane protein